jgi:ferredoxin
MNTKTAAIDVARSSRPFLASVSVEINGQQVFGRAGETLREVAARGVGLMESECRANACGGCVVRVLEGAGNLVPVGGLEEMLLGAEQLALGYRLGCQARLRGKVKVETVVRATATAHGE